MKLTENDIANLQAAINKVGNDAQITLSIPVLEKGTTRWQFSCPYCTAHGDSQPLDHTPSCVYSK